ncbi:MAG: ferrochelatase, partial [Planctomycetes bacterium]|nr:ferrochelatase [Planctomycetota bacterium]
INEQVRQLISALRIELDQASINLPIYWGNRNWHPLLPDTIQQMAEDGIKQALAFFTSAYSSYSGCRQYRENVTAACEQVGPNAPTVDKLRVFYNHPAFIAASVDRLKEALLQLPEQNRDSSAIAFTAHSIPNSMSDRCDYLRQLNETCRLIADDLQIPQHRWKLVFQSRSGRPSDPWLEPDILDHIRELSSEGIKSLVIAPVGFLSDHMEIMFDLDEEARNVCVQHSIDMVRAKTVGSHPLFIGMVRELIQERLDPTTPKRSIGKFGPNHDVCPVDCCLLGR